MHRSLAIILLSAVSTLATPALVNVGLPSQPLCSLVDSVISEYGAGAVATAWCSSYISIPVITSTTVSISTITSSADTTVTSALPVYCRGFQTKRKRNEEGHYKPTPYNPHGPRPTKGHPHPTGSPSWMSPWAPGPTRSSACSCLSVSTSTTTTTSISTTTTIVPGSTATALGPFNIEFYPLEVEDPIGFGYDDSTYVEIDGSSTQADTFVLLPNGELLDTSSGSIAQQVSSAGDTYEAPVQLLTAGSAEAITCSINIDYECELTCTSPVDGGTDSLEDNNEWYLGHAAESSLSQLGVFAVPVA